MKSKVALTSFILGLFSTYSLDSSHNKIDYKNGNRNTSIEVIRDVEFVVKNKRESDFECLRKNIFHEAANQNFDGMVAVANVVMNRVATKGYPNSICDVIYQAEYKNYKLVKNRCQFSWYCDGKSDNIRITKYNKYAWQQAGIVARMAITKSLPQIVGDATHYHAQYVTVNWNLEQVAVIGDHIFYR